MPGIPAGFASGPPPGGSISPSQLASQAAYTVLGNNTAGTASPTAVAPSAWPATTSAAGFMSAADKTKTDRYSYGAGSPEGVVTATVGCTYQDTTNGWIWQKLSGTGNTGWREISPSESGTYTPIYTAVANLDSVAASGVTHYARVGDECFVSGRATVVPKAPDEGAITFRMSLPFASAFAGNTDAVGVANGSIVYVGNVSADATNDQASVSCGNTVTTAYDVYYTYSYRVL